MAKNDHKRMQNEVDRSYNDTVYGYGGNAGTPDRTTMGRNGGTTIPGTPPTMGTGGMIGLADNLSTGSKGSLTYDDIMNQFKNFSNSGDMNASRAAYADLAGGGVNAEAMRDRAMNTVRAVYSNATRNLNRQRSLQGGYSPGYTTALTRMAREQGQGAADAGTSAEAAIQDLISRNKIAGAGGFANLGQMDLAANSARGNMYEGANSQLMQYQGLMNQIAQMMMQGRAQTANIPGNFKNAMGNIGDVLGLGGKIIGGMVGLGGGGIPQITTSGLGTF